MVRDPRAIINSYMLSDRIFKNYKIDKMLPDEIYKKWLFVMEVMHTFCMSDIGRKSCLPVCKLIIYIYTYIICIIHNRYRVIIWKINFWKLENFFDKNVAFGQKPGGQVCMPARSYWKITFLTYFRSYTFIFKFNFEI